MPESQDSSNWSSIVSAHLTLAQVRSLVFVSDLCEELDGISEDRVPAGGLHLNHLALIHGPTSTRDRYPPTVFIPRLPYHLHPSEAILASHGNVIVFDPSQLQSSRLRHLTLRWVVMDHYLDSLVSTLNHLREMIFVIGGPEASASWEDLDDQVDHLARVAQSREAGGSPLPFKVVVVSEDPEFEAGFRQSMAEALEILESRGVLSWRTPGPDDTFGSHHAAVKRCVSFASVSVFSPHAR